MDLNSFLNEQKYSANEGNDYIATALTKYSSHLRYWYKARSFLHFKVRKISSGDNSRN